MAFVLIVMAVAVGLVGLGAGLVSLGVTAPIASTGGVSPVLSITPCNDGETYTFDSGPGTWTCGTAGHTIQDETVGLAAEPTLNFTGAGVACVDNPGNTRTDCTITGVAGSGVQLDLGNDDVIESTGITEINVDNDTNSIFTETPADQLLIDASLNWPSSDTADALSANGGNCAAGSYPLGVDTLGAVESCTAEAFAFGTINAPLGTDPVADLVSDTLNLTSANSTINVTGTVGTDTVDFDAVDLNCTDCIGATEIADIYVLIAGDTMTGDLNMANGVGNTPKVTFTPATGTAWDFFTVDAGDDFQVEVDTASTETIDFVNVGAGDLDVTIDSLATGGPNECVEADTSGLLVITGSACGGSPTFDLIGSGTNTTAIMIVGSGSELEVGIGGHVEASQTLQSADNDSGATLFECTPVFISGFDIPSDLPEIDIADSDATAAAIGLAHADIANGADGQVVMAGSFDGLDTVTGEAWTVGDTLFVNDSGTSADDDCGNALTNVRPANTDDSVQPVAIVERVHATNGRLQVIVAGHGNNLPNLPDDQIWIGSATNFPTGGAIPDCDATNISRLQYDVTTNALSCDTDPVAAGEYAAASIDGDDVNSNIAGRSLTLTAGAPDTLDLDSEIFTDVKGFVLLDPTDSDDLKSIWRPSNFSVTIVSIYCETDAGTVTMDLEIDDGTPATVNGSVITCTTSGVDDSSLAGDTGLDADERLDLVITTVTTAATLSIQVEFTIND